MLCISPRARQNSCNWRGFIYLLTDLTWHGCAWDLGPQFFNCLMWVHPVINGLRSISPLRTYYGRQWLSCPKGFSPINRLFLQILTDSYQKTSLPGFYSFTTRITVFKKTCSSPWKVETSVQNCQDMAHLKAVLPLPGEDRLKQPLEWEVMGLNSEQQIIYLNNTRSYENHDLNQS